LVPNPSKPVSLDIYDAQSWPEDSLSNNKALACRHLY